MDLTLNIKVYHTKKLFEVNLHQGFPTWALPPTGGRWRVQGGRWSIKMNLGGAEADHRSLTKINIYPKLQKNISKI